MYSVSSISDIVSKTPLENMDVVTSGRNAPLWFRDAQPIEYSKLTKDLTVDDVVVGGGFTGVTTAYLLSKAGRNVALVDDGYIGSGESGRSTAHLTYALDSRYHQIIHMHGEDIARKVMQSHKAAIDLIEANVSREGLNCDFRRVDGYLYLNEESSEEELTKELEALKQMGNDDVQFMEHAGTSPFDPGLCLRFPMQGRVNPLKYLGGLCREIVRNGGKIFTETHITDFESPTVKARSGNKITAQNIVVATNVPVNMRAKMHMKQAPYRTYVVAFKVPKGHVSDALYWSTRLEQGGLANSYTYIRIHPLDEESDALIVGAQDHKTGQADDGMQRFATIKAWVKQHFPQSGEAIYAWSGQIVNPGDEIGFIGRDKDSLFLATGYSGNGTTYGTLAGMVLSDLIFGKENDWAEMYDPERKTLGSAIDIIEENFNVARKLVDSFIKGQDSQPENLALEQGSIVKRGMTTRLAFYKDDKGQLHAFSSVCPHMGCSVSWNSTEKTFDCPCHGSRYTGYGKVVNGPSNFGLRHAEEQK